MATRSKSHSEDVAKPSDAVSTNKKTSKHTPCDVAFRFMNDEPFSPMPAKKRGRVAKKVQEEKD
jgi:hypothetical protein